jgi:hypothetical protein
MANLFWNRALLFRKRGLWLLCHRGRSDAEICDFWWQWKILVGSHQKFWWVTKRFKFSDGILYLTICGFFCLLSRFMALCYGKQVPLITFPFHLSQVKIESTKIWSQTKSVILHWFSKQHNKVSDIRKQPISFKCWRSFLIDGRSEQWLFWRTMSSASSTSHDTNIGSRKFLRRLDFSCFWQSTRTFYALKMTVFFWFGKKSRIQPIRLAWKVVPAS